MTRVLIVVSATIFAAALFTRAVDPVIPQIAADLSVDVGTAALLSTAFAIPYALTQPILGALADTVGKMRMMTICLLVLTLSSLVGAFATSFWVLLVTRVVAGVAAGGVFPIGLAVVGDLVPVSQRQVAIGRLLMATMLGNLLGSSGGGAVGDLAGWRGVLVSAACVGAAALAVSVIGLRGAVTERRSEFILRGQIANFRAIMANPNAKFCFAAVFVEGTVLFGLFPHVAALFHAEGETRAFVAGVVLAGFGLGGLSYTFVVSPLVKYFSVRQLMAAGGTLMGLALIGIGFTTPWPVDLALFLLLGFAFYLLHGPIQVFVTELVPAARGAATALHSSFFFFGQATGPVLYTLGFAYLGLWGTLGTGAVMVATAGMVCALFLKSRQSDDGDEVSRAVS